MTSGGNNQRRRRLGRGLLRSAAAALVLIAFGVAASAAAAAPQFNIVSQGTFPTNPPANVHYFNTIQKAVNASTSPGDYVLIKNGVYTEEVKVGPAQSGIWIRGMNRNKVILDGQWTVGNGIEINDANNVWVENLTVRNFEFGGGCQVEECGNDIWWNGREPGKKTVNAHGWYGEYLTAYTSANPSNPEDGKKGGYGIFTGSETEGKWNNIYASGFADSGIYVGACQECNATIKNAVMEDNALGYSGSNAGGKLVIERSTFAHNTVGIAPNSENPGDPPPPQDGECGRPNIEEPNPTPTISSTKVKRCTVLRGNKIVDNNNLEVPPNGSTEVAPWGVGVELPGDYADLVENNTISGNPNAGVLGFEYPNPFPLFPGAENTIDFQLSGNRISSNTFSGNGYNTNNPVPFQGDIDLFSGAGQWLNENYGFSFPPTQSTNNCVVSNRYSNPAQPVTFPANIQGTWSCANNTTPNPGGGELAVDYLIGNLEEARLYREAVPPVAQQAPPEQPTMPNACMGVPKYACPS